MSRKDYTLAQRRRFAERSAKVGVAAVSAEAKRSVSTVERWRRQFNITARPKSVHVDSAVPHTSADDETDMVQTWLQAAHQSGRGMGHSPLICAVAKHCDTPPELLETIAQSPYSLEIEAVVSNPNCPPSLLRSLFESSDDQWVLNALAKNPSLPSDLVSSALEHSIAHVRSAAACNPNLSTQQIEGILERNEAGQMHAMIRSAQENLTVEHLDRLLDIQQPSDVREAAAGHPRASEVQLLRVLSDPEPSVRSAACRNPAVAAPKIEALALNDPSYQVRAEVLKRQGVSRQVLETAFGDSNNRDVYMALASNPGLHEAVAIQLLRDRRDMVIASIIASPHTPYHLVADFLVAPSVFLRGTFAKRADLTDEDCQQLMNDEDREVRCDLAANKNTPGWLVDELLQTEDDDIAHIVAMRPNLEGSQVERLLTHSSRDVRAQAARYQKLNDAQMQRAMSDHAEVQANAILSHGLAATVIPSQSLVP